MNMGKPVKSLAVAMFAMLMLFTSMQGVLGSTTGGSGFTRWVALEETGAGEVNMTVPERVYNDFNYSYSGTFTLPTGSGTYYVNMSFGGSGTIFNMSSGALSANGTFYVNTTASLQIPNGSTYVNVTLVDSSFVVQDFWNGTVSVTTRTSYNMGISVSNIMGIMIALFSFIILINIFSLFKNVFDDGLGSTRRRR